MKQKRSKAQLAEPVVLVYIGGDDPSRGDSHGFKGIGQRLAQKLAGTFHYLEDSHLAELYPEEQSTEAALKRYFADHKAPDIVLSRQWDKYAMKGQNPLLCITSVNEGLSEDYLGEYNLVSHHLTPELLESEGRKFREHYPALPHPLIAVMMVNVGNTWSFSKKLVEKCAAYPKATIFLCSSRRTRPENYAALAGILTDMIKERGMEQHIRFEGYDFNDGRTQQTLFNPYVGLLQEADHVIVCGWSQSLVSEPLAAGKPVMLYEARPHGSLQKKGLAFEFNACAARAPFETGKIKPVNVTEDIAGVLARKFRQKRFWHRLNPFSR